MLRGDVPHQHCTVQLCVCVCVCAWTYLYCMDLRSALKQESIDQRVVDILLLIINCALTIWLPGTVSVLTSLSSISTLCSVLRGFLWESQCFLRVTILIISLLDQTSTEQIHAIPNNASFKKSSNFHQHWPQSLPCSYHLYTHSPISASAMYAIQSTTNSCTPSVPLACSGSPQQCCEHVLSSL